MKHPVDTSQWGEFVVGELFETNGNKTYTGAGIPKNNLEAGSTPRITVTDKNNGIIEYFNDTDNANYRVYENFISVSFLGTVFWHPYKASVDMKVHVLNKPKSTELNEERALFLVACIKKTIATFSYAEQLSASKLYDLTIKLPLKPSADPSNYTQDDIDWDYMETVMSRVIARAKDRLANLPQPTDKKKTPVDTSNWGEFDITTLFDIINTKSIRQSDVQEQLQSNDGSIPYITANDKNNAIAAYIECPQEWIDKGNCIFIGGKTTTITYQTQDFCSNDSHNLALYLKNEQARTKYIQLYLASILKKAFAKYHWGNALSKTKIKAESIKLPLKPSADQSNYTQEDIDWNYMENFMKTIEEKAHDRLKSLQKTIA